MEEELSLQHSKRRVAGRQLSRDNPGLDDDESTEQESGTFKRASDNVMASRRIVKVRRNQTSSAASTPSSNPFAGICLVPPVVTSSTPALVTTEAESERKSPESLEEKDIVNNKCKNIVEENPDQSSDKADEPKDKSTIEGQDDNSVKPDEPESADVKTREGDKKEDEDKEDYDTLKNENKTKKDADNERTENSEKGDTGNENVEKGADTSPLSSFQMLSSSQNAFTGLAGTGFSSSSFSFGATSKDGSPQSFGSTFAVREQQSFSFGVPSNGSGSLFGTSGGSTVSKTEESKFPARQEVSVETGEENEKPVFTTDCVLFEFLDGGWKERGKGELKLNVSTTGIEKARLIMRTRGNYRLVLNTNLYPDMKLTDMEKRGITFACVNSATDTKEGLSMYALKFKDAAIVEEFRAAIAEHKGKPAVAVKTPENSPKHSDD